MVMAYLERHNKDLNLHRFYRLTLCPTLFGAFALIREWGRCSEKPSFTRCGHRHETWFACHKEALEAYDKLLQRKCIKGYQLQQQQDYRKSLLEQPGQKGS